MHDVMLRSLPVTDPAGLYRIGSGNDCCVEGGPHDNWGMYSFPLFERLRSSAPEFEQVAAFQAGPNRYSVLRLNIDQAAKALRGEFVTGNYFSVFGIRPFVGRVFSASDDVPSASPATVISYRAWQMYWGADAAAIGSGAVIWGELINVDGHPPAGMNEDSVSSWDRVSAGYFETVGQPVLRGRGIRNADARNTENIAVVNETFVRRFFPNEDPLDKHFGIDMPAYARTYRVVGVVRDAKYTQPTRPPRPMFFVALTQSAKYKEDLMQIIDSRSHFIGSVLLRSHAKTGYLEPLLRKAFAEADPNLTIISVRTMNEQTALVFDQQRAVASLAGLFGVVALILAAVGLYGVTAYTVVQRTSEIGIRMALGADAGGVLRLVRRGAFTMVGIGLMLGIPLAIGAGRLISAQLYGVNGWDPMALGIAITALAVCAFVAAIIPALRTASIDPIERAEHGVGEVEASSAQLAAVPPRAAP